VAKANWAGTDQERCIHHGSHSVRRQMTRPCTMPVTEAGAGACPRKGAR
jgi:hypothetical protein